MPPYACITHVVARPVMHPGACMRALEALWVQVVLRDFAPEEDEETFGMHDEEEVRYRFSGPGEETAPSQQPPAGRGT